MLRDRPKSLKTGSDSSTVKRSAIDMSVRVLGDDHYKRMPRVTIGVVRSRTLTVQWP